jgi:hypothetical protein
MDIPDDAMKGIRSASEPLCKAAGEPDPPALFHRGLSATGPTGNRYGDAAGHSCMAVAGRSHRRNDYSTPTSHGFQDVLVKGFVEQVVILCRGEEIARHGRSYGQGVFVYDPLHYLATRCRHYGR